MNQELITEYFQNFQNKKVLIIGDVMIDSYLFGKVDRISPEAPVPVVSVTKRLNRLGGAANVALNIHALGAVPILCSVIGEDEKSNDFMNLLEEKGLPKIGILKSSSRKTTTKFRVIGNNVQMLRVDEEMTETLNEKDLTGFKTKIHNLILNEEIDVIVFEDYDKGCINSELIAFVAELAQKNNIPVTADPKKRNFNHYKGITVLKPNFKELKEGLNISIEPGNMSKIAEASLQLMAENELDNVMVTLSEHGVLLCQGMVIEHIPAHIRTISDVSGAGDTVISVLSLAMVSGFTLSQAARIANLAGGLVCEEIGVVPVNYNRLLQEVLINFN